MSIDRKTIQKAIVFATAFALPLGGLGLLLYGLLRVAASRRSAEHRSAWLRRTTQANGSRRLDDRGPRELML